MGQRRSVAALRQTTPGEQKRNARFRVHDSYALLFCCLYYRAFITGTARVALFSVVSVRVFGSLSVSQHDNS